MYNNTYSQYPQYNGGQAFGVAQPKAANSQPLTPEMATSLRQEGSEVNMKVDQRDLWRAMCTHKDPTTGQNTLYQNEDGSYTCSICGKTFNMFEGSSTDVEIAVKTLIDMLQTCKTIYLDAPLKMTEQYYQIMCLLEKFPALWNLAVRNFSKYENVSNPLNPISNQYGGFNALNTLLTNPYMQGYYQQPVMAQPTGYPMAAQPANPMGYGMPTAPVYGQPIQQNVQQPMMNQNVGYPMMAQPADPNPMGYGAVPAAPMAPMPGAVPVQSAAPVANAAPAPAAQNGEIQQQKVFNV